MSVVWTLPSLDDLDQIQEYVVRESPKSAFRLINIIIDRTEAVLAEAPLAGRDGRVAGTRELVLSGTSHIVVYRVKRDVEIVAIVHGARDWPSEFQ